MVVEISMTILCLQILECVGNFHDHFVFVNTEMVLEISMTILCLQILEISTTISKARICLTPFLAKNYQTFQWLGNFSNKYDNLCHKFLFLSINGVSSHFIATLLLQNMEHLVKSLPYYLKSQENW